MALRVQFLFGGFAYRNHYDGEVQVLARQFVVGVEGDGGIVAGGHLDGNGLTGAVVQRNVVADDQTFAAGQLLLEAIGIDRDKVCTYCWTGKGDND